MDDTTPSVAIIGAGPVGLFSVFACGMMRIHCHVIDALPHTGGQCQALYPEKPIYDIPGFPEVTGAALVAHLLHQAQPFSPTWHLGQPVTHLETQEKGWRLHTTNTKLDVQAVIIAAGAGAFTPHRPPLEQIEHFENKSVFYAVGSREHFQNKHIVIAGGGDSAVDWALSLSERARSLSLVHRRANFRAAPAATQALQEKIAQGKIILHTPYQLHSLSGDTDSGQLSHVTVVDMEGKTKRLDADILLPFFGLKTSLGPIADWGLALEHKRIIIDPTTTATNQDGIYAVGDVAIYPHKRTLILTGFAEAAQAAASLRRTLFPEAPTLLGHSTARGKPTL